MLLSFEDLPALSRWNKKYAKSLDSRGIRLKSLGRLFPDRWINDDVVNAFGGLLAAYAVRGVVICNSFFAQKLSRSGYNGVSRWYKKEVRHELPTCN